MENTLLLQWPVGLVENQQGETDEHVISDMY